MKQFKHTPTCMLLASMALASTLPAFAQSDAPATKPAAADASSILPEPEGTPVEGQILMQSDNTILAEDLLGLAVYSPEDERVGEISDLIVTLDGGVTGAVIGVGGFLGIGEKEVAIEMQRLELTPLEGNDMRLVLATNKEELEAAPAFVSKYTQQAAEDAAILEQNMKVSPGLSEPRPAVEDESGS